MLTNCLSRILSTSKALLFGRAILLLSESSLYAVQTDSDPWDYAAEIRHLAAIGLCENDLRYLVRLGLVDHRCEVAANSVTGRRFLSSGDLTFTDQTCFILTPLGIAAAAELELGQSQQCFAAAIPFVPVRQLQLETAAPIPKWDANRRTLLFERHVVKQFKRRAVNQEVVLSAFQEDGWPVRIDDPLSPLPMLDAKRRLSDTIRTLNQNQAHAAIHFRGDGSGQGITWEVASRHSIGTAVS